MDNDTYDAVTSQSLSYFIFFNKKIERTELNLTERKWIELVSDCRMSHIECSTFILKRFEWIWTQDVNIQTI